ncbi:hypothetical protein GMJAKD_15495 [Candidatus Electrothrix aarhusensis]
MNRKQKLRIKAKLVANPYFMSMMAWCTRHTPKFFMLHRFIPGESDSFMAMSAGRFEKQLQVLKKGPWQIVTLGDYLQLRQQQQKIPPYLIVLTIDDGYLDFYKIAFPLLKKYNLPATFFVTTEFVNGNFWLWHDRIHYVLGHAKTKEFSFVLDGQEQSFNIRESTDRFNTWKTFSDYCIQARDDVKFETLAKLEKTLDVILPKSPPDEYAAVSWEQLREMAANNIEIGSHTCNHPILSKINMSKLEEEIALSKKIITEKLNIPVYSFCYPNGQDNDINDHVVESVEQAKYLGAVQGSNRDFSHLFRLPRMGIGNDLIDFHWKLCGLESLLHNHG